MIKTSYLKFAPVVAALVLVCPASAHDDPGQHHDESWEAALYAPAMAHAPTPIPDRVVLTWSADPATTQSVTWRTDTSVKKGIAEFAIANANGRALAPQRVSAATSFFRSDLNEAHYHTVTFSGLAPDTLYAYRVGDGVNWSEYFHFRTATRRPRPFSFIYFGDAQNELKTHWSRVFREAFRDAPRAAFTLHAGDLINEDSADAEWGEWNDAPAWVNGTIPVIATPGNHEYYRANQGPVNERFWASKDGLKIAVDVQVTKRRTGGKEHFTVLAQTQAGDTVQLEFDGDGAITAIGPEIVSITGFTRQELLGTKYYDPPLDDRRRVEGIPKVSDHWRPQFAFPVQDVPEGLEETVYYIDYQGVRIISLDSNKDREAQIPWLRRVLEDNPNRWTILTFHHPVFSPARDRDNPELREAWKPIIDEFRVDLVLTGHDHTYARTGDISSATDVENVPQGYQQAYDPDIGTVYVVSVSGPKMYRISKGQYAKRVAENTQLYQIIEIDDRELRFRAYTATGQLYDAFTLEKRAGRPNRLREILPPENRSSADD
jgi:3',5'-cyclic AMP phosphodiesterase CpdA